VAIEHKHGKNLFIRNSARKYFERQGIGACSNDLRKGNNSCDSVLLFPIAVVIMK